jgi:hypothetical protein
MLSMFALQFGDPELVVHAGSNSKFYIFSHLSQADEVVKFHYD